MKEKFEIKRAGPKEIRCMCGSLVARLLPTGLELKCKRCKRLHLIPVTVEREDVMQ